MTTHCIPLLLTALPALFRREDAPAIANHHKISERQVRRMHFNLRTYGTVTRPHLKKMGRPAVLSTEIEEDLKQYVSKYPMALLVDMQKHVQATFNVTCSRASISRRLGDLGFSRGIIRRGFRASDTTLPVLSQVDYERIRKQQEEDGCGSQEAGAVPPTDRQIVQESAVEGDALSNPNSKKTKYAWLLDGEPLKHPKRKKNHSQAYTRSDGGTPRAVLANISRDLNIQPGLDKSTATGHEQLDLRHLSAAAERELALSQLQSHYPPMPDQASDLTHPNHTGERSPSHFGPVRT